ncbi:MAG: Phosphotransferase enzyme family protein [Betaproteobacteria bacterium ADurb.Bin341]|nr:MAG: Phosphotransferase enzyme family protein [Betaproteobacteria bacterium ADurb.Bin341]
MAVAITPASADASFRRYFRLTLPNGETRILMDAPPDKEDCHPFVTVARLLEDAGLNAPRVLFEDLERGFLLLTDLGNALYLETLHSDGQRADALFADAIAALIAWQKSSKPGVLPPYDHALLKRELDLFPDWFLKRHLNLTLDNAQQGTLDRTVQFLINNALAQPKVFVHRDYMPRNLMLADPNPGILDFQDAVYGPITYDVVSLFRDAFISWEEEREHDWVVRYWQQARAANLAVPEDFAVFWRDYELMGLQRHLKVLGIFCRLNYRDGKDRYLTDLPRFMAYARHTASRYDELAPFHALLDSLPLPQ